MNLLGSDISPPHLVDLIEGTQLSAPQKPISHSCPKSETLAVENNTRKNNTTGYVFMFFAFLFKCPISYLSKTVYSEFGFCQERKDFFLIPHFSKKAISTSDLIHILDFSSIYKEPPPLGFRFGAGGAG